MPPLRRHQLAWLSAAGWQDLSEANCCAWDGQARDCLRHWADHDLPLVVTRQPLPQPGDPAPASIALGLSAPPVFGRRLLGLRLPASAIARFGEFPALCEAAAALPRALRAEAQALHEALQQQGLNAHAYGSAGWQWLTGQRYLHARSDLDLWLAVQDAGAADAAAALLQRHAPEGLRLDGELVFPDGGAVAWREWAAWRAGRSRALLVKRLHGASLEQALPEGWEAPALARAA
ncbi:malonate decarboxylase holo-[acyl-carrier-protein] synthase [Azohydromonas aeria]|uniref:malonate decarboxylase holo-[acyl-carrier-protein] synthase n=1 Tax=Azohydromonas aeria TaxID=2590212 RepID=UPI0012FA25B9|nr:malonate decarboxylase holo-[acyl-carrier-protein] synthase [Azohydromonas aeria]